MHLAARHPIDLVIPAGLLVLGLFIYLPRHSVTRFRGHSRNAVARTIAKQYAYEAYAQWTAEHVGRTCPSLAELDGYLHRDHSLDPWGRPYLMTCDRSGILVRSAGEDQKWFTSDDLTSRQ